MASSKPTSNLRFMLRALGYRNYRLFLGGQIVSLVGTWLTNVASSWLVYRLSREAGYPAPLMLGLIGFASQFPVFLFTPLAGVWVDRWNRHRILMATQTAAMLQSFALAFLVLSGWITIWQVIALALVQGLITSLDMPTRQSFIVEMVDQPDDLANAIALNSSMVHSSRLVGPALAGYLIYAVGEGYCFLIDGFSYVAVLLALALMRLAHRPRAAVTARPLAAFVEGTRYAFGFAPIRTLLLMVAVTSLAAMSQMTLMPIFAGTILGGGERTLGWLLGASGLGAVVGSLFLAARKSVLGLGRVIAMACALLGVTLIAFAVTRFVPLSLVLLVVAGFALVTQMAASNTVLQTIVDEEKRGRVMALYSMAFLGVAPIGSLIGGGVATLAGAPVALVISGVVCLVTAALFARQLPKMRPLVQPIYRSRGILPEIAAGIESTEAIAPAQE